MVYFQTKNPNLGNFWQVLQRKMLVFYGHFVYFTAKWYISVHFVVICYIFPVLVCCNEKNLATLSLCVVPRFNADFRLAEWRIADCQIA
jgi:hypothetical protein